MLSIKRTSPLLRYGVAIVAVGVALGIKLLLDPLIPQDPPFLLLFGAIMVSAWYGGLGAGLLTMVLAGLATGYFFLYRQGFSSGLEAVPLLVFFVEGTLVCLLTGALRAARSRAETSKAEAERDHERLRRSEEHFRSLVEGMREHAIFTLDPQGRVATWDVGAEHLAGYTAKEIVGQHFSAFFTEADVGRGRPEKHLEVAADDGRSEEEGHFVRKDGSRFFANTITMTLHDRRGRLRGFSVVAQDITEKKEAEEKLKESEGLYRNVVEQVAENIFLLDPCTGRIIQANASLLRSLGYEASELRRLTLYDIVAHDRESVELNIGRVLEKGHLILGERRYRRKDGSLIDAEVSVGAIAYAGRPALCVVAHDVTQRKRAEEALKRSLNVQLALNETARILGSSLEWEEIGSRLLEVVRRVSNLTAAVIAVPNNEGGLRIWRSSGLEGLQRRARFAPEALSARQKVLETREHRVLRMRRPEDPEERCLVGLYLPLLVQDRLIGVLEAYGPDALATEDTGTLYSLASQAASALENARLYTELSERENQLRDLVGRLITAQEEERHRVAYDVHDGLAQTAAAAHQHLQAFARHHSPCSAELREELDEALELVRELVGEARQVIYDLRPTVLDDFGLSAAVRLQVATLRAEGLEISLEESLGEERLPPEVETTLFRVAQEALTNIRKHAQASRVRVVLDRPGNAVRLLVRDDGRGFRPNGATKRSGPGEKVGLSGMRERVSLLGGRFELRSESGAGTTVEAEFELPETREDPDHGG
jgi:PAS domain S-box-containing protein